MRPTRRTRAGLVAGGVTALESWFLRRRTGSWLGWRTIVRCRAGHLFTTTWLPGVSVKALRLGPWRVQRCPIGRHWSIVTPVPPGQLSPGQRDGARAVRDTRLP